MKAVTRLRIEEYGIAIIAIAFIVMCASVLWGQQPNSLESKLCVDCSSTDTPPYVCILPSNVAGSFHISAATNQPYATWMVLCTLNTAPVYPGLPTTYGILDLDLASTIVLMSGTGVPLESVFVPVTYQASDVFSFTVQLLVMMNPNPVLSAAVFVYKA